MLSVREFLGDDFDPISSVRREFESFYTDDYFHPSNGDVISDSYWQAIDITTKPSRLGEDDLNGLNYAITHLNERQAVALQLLRDVDVIEAYVHVLEQINELNAQSPRAEEIEKIDVPELAAA